MNRDNLWQLRRPKRWFNALLFYSGWSSLFCHLCLMLFCLSQEISYPLNWWFVALAPALSILWGGVGALQLQTELPARDSARLLC